MPVRKRERGSGVWGASRTVDETGVWWAGQCGRPGLVGGARMWRGGAVVSRCGSSAPHWGGRGPALGQETGYWSRLITCPNGCFRAPMRIPRLWSIRSA